MWFTCSASTAICENSDGVLLAPTGDLCTIHPEKLFLCYNQYCVKTIVLQQLWLVLVLRAWGEVKGLGGFLLLLAALADTPSYIPIIIPCMSRPKILTDRDLPECSCFLFSNHIRNIATGETSQAITPIHFFDNYNFHHLITFSL